MILKERLKGLLFSLKFGLLLFKRNLKTTVFITLIFSLILSLPTLTKSVTDGFGIKIKKDVYRFIGDFVIKSINEKNLNKIYSKLNQLPYIQFYIPVYATNVLIKDKNENKVGCNLLIVDDFERFVEINNLNKKLIEGTIETGKKGILLGKELTTKGKLKLYPKPLDVESGDNVQVLIENKVLNLKVMGIYTKGEPSLDTFALVPAKSIEESNFKPNKIILFLKEEYKRKSDEIYKDLVNEFPSYTVNSIKEEMTTIDSFLKTFSLISSITFFFGTLIAVVIIYSLISINVRNKRVEIGILRALGVRERFIIYTYLFLTIFYLISSLALSVIILKLFEIFFYYNPIHSPFGLIRPAIDYKFFIVNFIKLSIFLIFIAYLPIKEVVKENLLSQIRS